jgi:hypothetical protein
VILIFFWCQFATDAQLVCQYGGNINMTGQIVGFSRPVTVGVDGRAQNCWARSKAFMTTA